MSTTTAQEICTHSGSEFEKGSSIMDDLSESQDWFVNEDKDRKDTSMTRRQQVSKLSQTKNITSGYGHTESESDSRSKTRLNSNEDCIISTSQCSTDESSPTQMSGQSKFKQGRQLPILQLFRSSNIINKISYREQAEILNNSMLFLHYSAPRVAPAIMLMQAGTSKVAPKRYGSKYIRFYIPQVHDDQIECCLYARKRIGKQKIRFSLRENVMPKWPIIWGYRGKMKPTQMLQSKVPGACDSFSWTIEVTKQTPKATFEILKEARKQQIIIRIENQKKRFGFRPRADSSDNNETYRSLIQKFINPLTDIRCPDTNDTLFKMEKEGDNGIEKYIVSYASPVSLFVGCCLAVGIESHLLD